MRIREALDPAAIAAVRDLFVEYEKALGVDLCFQGFAAELEGLPGDYAPPRGRLLLVERGGLSAGCIAMRPLDSRDCEMKRLYVRPAARGDGLGLRLVERVIAEARGVGYARMYLDTLPQMDAAQRLYERLGFEDVPPYRDNPVKGARFMALDL